MRRVCCTVEGGRLLSRVHGAVGGGRRRHARVTSNPHPSHRPSPSPSPLHPGKLDVVYTNQKIGSILQAVKIDGMIKGVKAIGRRLQEEGRIHGVVALGGAEGSVLAAATMTSWQTICTEPESPRMAGLASRPGSIHDTLF